MRFGLWLGRLNPARWPEVTVLADEAGFETAWLSEHLVLPMAMAGSPIAGESHPPLPPETPVFDAVAYLSYLAGLTHAIQLGTWVYLLGLRHPFVSARAFQTLDMVSNGRAVVGVGAGWLRSEYEAAGADFATRGTRLDEALAVCRRLWTEPVVEHHGSSWAFEAVAFEPKPLQRPHPPVLIGGESPPALRRAARADGWLGMQHTPATARPIVEELHRLRAEADLAARPFRCIAATTDPVIDVGAWEDAGVDQLIVAPWQSSRDFRTGFDAFRQEYLP